MEPYGERDMHLFQCIFLQRAAHARAVWQRKEFRESVAARIEIYRGRDHELAYMYSNPT